MLDRRLFLGQCVGSAAMFASGASRAIAGSESPARLAFRLKETAGLRRFSYPVHTVLPQHAQGADTRYRLLENGKEISAQFRSSASNPRDVQLDFNASPGPLESTEYIVEYGSTVKPIAESKRGLGLCRDSGAFRIGNQPYLTYSIPENLAGLIQSIKTPKLEYFAPTSRGLFFTQRGRREQLVFTMPQQSNESSVVRRWEGPISIGLQFNGEIVLPEGHRLKSVVELVFVNSKSWIETTWTIEDPDNHIGSMGFDLNLLIQGSPTLVDCGASTTVYSHLQKDEVLAFEGRPESSSSSAKPRWSIEQGKGSDLKTFAAAFPNDRAAEGWVHVMDHDRCSAISVDEFGMSQPDRIRIEAGGRVVLERSHAESNSGQKRSTTSKSLRFWIHVVPTPVQVGAVTSPQAMLAPLVVDWTH